MIAGFIVRESDTPAKIGTHTTRELTLVDSAPAPEYSFDGAQAISIDRKTVQTTVVAGYETIMISYVFHTSELVLDNEFRRSIAGYGDTTEMDFTNYPWIARNLLVAVNLDPITTEYIPCDYHRRTLTGLVVG